MIELDLKRLQELQGKLKANPNDAELLYQSTLSAARMLLVTRGVEARSEEDVFILYRRHFLDTGWVDASFQVLIEVAQNRDLPSILLRKADVHDLIRTMEELYRTMDNAWRFPGETAKPAA